MTAKQCSVEAAYSDNLLAIRVNGEIDHHTAASIRADIDREIYFYRAEKVVIDLSGVSFMDSSGLGIILGRYAKIKELGGTLAILDPTPEIMKILRLAGADRLVTIKCSAASAREGKR